MTSKESETLGEMVQRLRDAAGLGIRELANLSGVDAANISRLERGEATHTRVDTLTRLAAALGASPADLLIAAGCGPADALPSFTPYLRTKYGHLPAAKRRELAEYFERIEAEYGSKPKPTAKKSSKRTTKGGH